MLTIPIVRIGFSVIIIGALLMMVFFDSDRISEIASKIYIFGVCIIALFLVYVLLFGKIIY